MLLSYIWMREFVEKQVNEIIILIKIKTHI